MLTRKTRQALFFVLIFLLFILGTKTNQLWVKHTSVSFDVSMVIIGILFTLVVVALYYLSDLDDNCENWDVSASAFCKGGPYLWQGDSFSARYCRSLANSPKGRYQIASHNCPTGYKGAPKIPFMYTPLSNAQWKNERCTKTTACPLHEKGLCSMTK